MRWAVCVVFTWISLQALLSWSFASAQPAGYLSIDCGSDSSHTDAADGIEWIPDAGTMKVGEAVRVGEHVDPVMSTMQLFKGNQSKYCYIITNDAVKKGAFFLVRASFWPGSTPIYTPQRADGFHFKYAIDGDDWKNISFPYYRNSSWWFTEAYTRAQRSSIYFCLARSTPDGDVPFISSLELRPLPSTMFAATFMTSFGRALTTYKRYDYGASSLTEYPLDELDRVWFPSPAMAMVDTISTTAKISTSTNDNKPPSNVLQTAIVGKAVNDSFFTISFSGLDVNNFYWGQFHFAEIDPRVTAPKQRMFNIYVNGELWNTDEPIDIFQQVGANTSHSRVAGDYPTKDGNFTFNFSAASNSSFPPLLSAGEYFRFSAAPSFNLSFPSDGSAIEDIKFSMSLSNFTGDPCIPAQYGYSWVECTSSLTPATIPRITVISLSSYGVAGVIPKSINTLTMLSQILLDGNELSGPIPDLGDLTNLVTLKLNNNSLSGFIPESLATLKTLKVLHLQNNNLSGVIPAALLEQKKAGTLDFEYYGNEFSCEGECSTSLPPTGGSSKSTATKIGVIAGVSIVGILLVLMTGVIIVRKRMNKNKETHKPSKNQHAENLLSSPSPNPDFERLKPKLLIQELSFEQIKVATSNFATQLGRGRFGNVFKGQLEDERIVAVKVASSSINQQPKEFLNEVEILSRVHHKNLVDILGYCKADMLVLIYEFMSNGSLYDCLHGKFAKDSPLPWSTRLGILVNAAQGLEYLHHGCNPPIIHRDVKSSNILLNEKMEAKISDFGISRGFLHETNAPATTLMGTMGYMDPEYIQHLKMTRKVDVYSFGVLIFEVVCGRKPMFRDSSNQEIYIVNWAKLYMEQDSIYEIIDGTLHQEYHAASMWSVLETAKACVQCPSTNRPDMSIVYQALKDAKEMVFLDAP